MYLHLGLIFEMGRFAISVEQRQQVSPGCVRHRPNVPLLVRDANEAGQQEQCHLHFLFAMNWINKKVGKQISINLNSSSFVFSLSTSFALYNPSFLLPDRVRRRCVTKLPRPPPSLLYIGWRGKKSFILSVCVLDNRIFIFFLTFKRKKTHPDTRKGVKINISICIRLQVFLFKCPFSGMESKELGLLVGVSFVIVSVTTEGWIGKHFSPLFFLYFSFPDERPSPNRRVQVRSCRSKK